MKPIEQFYRFQMTAGADEPDNAELLIFSQIGDWEDMGDVSAKAFARDLAALPKSVKRLDIHINSPGGSLFEASAIYSRLADHSSQKIVYVDGLAASAASLVAMVGHKIYIRANATMMIHMPGGIVMGNAEEMRKMAGALDTISESMINIYSKRTKLPREDVRALLAAESWFDPALAVEKGFADEVRGVVKAAAMTGNNRAVFNGAEFDLSRFRNVPAFNASTNQNQNMNPTNTPAPAAPPDNPPPAPQSPPPAAPPPNTAPTPPANPPTPPAAPAAPPANPPPTAAANPPANESDYDRGMRMERERVTALQKLDRPATHAIIEAAIKDGKQPSDIFAECMTAMDKAGRQNNRRADADVLNQIPPSDDGSDPNSFGDEIRNAVTSQIKRRGGRKVRLSGSRN